MKKIVGIDIGGTKCAITLAEYSDENINIIDKLRFSTCVSNGPGYAIGKLIEGIKEIAERNLVSLDKVASIGISCGGPLDSRNGIILSPPNLPGWDNIHITKIIEESFGVKATLQNDANACALAEWRFGAGKGHSSMVFLTFGTGMGAGIILNNRLYVGASDMAGEIGHIRLEDHGPVGYGKSGSFEGFCSGGGIAQYGRTMALEKLQKGEKTGFCSSIEDMESITAKTIAEAAEKGDETAIRVYEACGTYLGRGLAILMDILNPEIIIIGSIYGRCRKLLYSSMLMEIEREALTYTRKECIISEAGLKESIGDYGALAAAIIQEDK